MYKILNNLTIVSDMIVKKWPCIHPVKECLAPGMICYLQLHGTNIMNYRPSRQITL